MPTGRLAQATSVELGAGSTQKAELHGHCLGLEGLSGPEPQLLACQNKFTSHLIKNLRLNPGTRPRHMQWRWGAPTQPPAFGGHPGKTCREETPPWLSVLGTGQILG